MKLRHLRDDEVDQATEMLARAFVGWPFPSLLADMFRRLDREHLPAYLDTNVSENVAFTSAVASA